MPDLTTHYLFGEKVSEQLSPALQALVARHPAVFAFSTQGPDLLFFRKAIRSTFSAKSPLPQYARRMHHEHIRETLIFMKTYTASKQSDKEEYDILSVYTLGFICHYYLDKTVHPYVYFLVDSIRRCHPERTQTSVHVQIEAELDTIFYEFFKKQPIASFSVKQHFSIDHRSKNIIGKLYSELLKDVYGVRVELQEVMMCFEDMLKISRLLYDKTGVLLAASNLLGRLFPITRDATNHLKPTQVKMDTANFNGNGWHPLQRPSDRMHKSVLTLFEEAKEEVVPILEDVYSHMSDACEITFDTSIDFRGNAIPQ